MLITRLHIYFFYPMDILLKIGPQYPLFVVEGNLTGKAFMWDQKQGLLLLILYYIINIIVISAK